MSTNNDDLKQVERGPRHGDVYRFDVTGIDENGHGISHLEVLVGPQKQYKKYKFALRGGVPGDTVLARVTQPRKRKREANVSEIETESTDRVEPRCAHIRIDAAPKCGGCSMQAIRYDRQLELKRDLLVRRLASTGVHDPVDEVIGMEDPWFYRNKMEWSFGEAPDGNLGLGMHPPGYRYEVLDHQHCFIAPEPMLPLVETFVAWGRRHDLKPQRGQQGTLATVAMRFNSQDHVALTLKTSQPVDEALLSELVADLAAEPVSLHHTQIDAERGRKTIETTTPLIEKPWEETLTVNDRSLNFLIEPGAFFQTNTRQTEILYKVALDVALSLSDASVPVWDLYCGAGTISCFLATVFEHVVGIERVAESVRSAQENVRKNGLENVRFLLGDAQEIFKTEEPPGLVVVDPPRAGLHQKVIESLANMRVSVVYVSCNPKTLAPDLRRFKDLGYQITTISPVDMFPHTPHVETVVGLRFE